MVLSFIPLIYDDPPLFKEFCACPEITYPSEVSCIEDVASIYDHYEQWMGNHSSPIYGT